MIQHGQPQVERLALEDLLWRFAAPQTPDVHHEHHLQHESISRIARCRHDDSSAQVSLNRWLTRKEADPDTWCRGCAGLRIKLAEDTTGGCFLQTNTTTTEKSVAAVITEKSRATATRLDTPELTSEGSGLSGKAVLGCPGMVLSSTTRRVSVIAVSHLHQLLLGNGTWMQLL